MPKHIQLFSMIMVLSLMLAACRDEAEPEPTPIPTAKPVEAPAEEGGTDDAQSEKTIEETDSESVIKEEAAKPTTIKIGFVGPLTGESAFIGQEQLGFVKVAVELFNEQTDLKVEVVEEDTELNPDTGEIVVEHLASEGEIIGVVGPTDSQVCKATLPIFVAAGLAHITPSCTSTTLTQPGTATFFRPIPTDAAQSRADAAYMVDELGVTSAFLVDDLSGYSLGLNDELEAALASQGVTDIQRMSMTQAETDFSAVVTAVLAADSEVVFFPSRIEGQSGALTVQLRERGFAGIIFLTEGGFSLNWVSEAGDAADGTYLSLFTPDPNLISEAAEYNARYTEQYTESFGPFGGAAALAAQILLEAIERCVTAGNVSRACVVTETAVTDMETSMLGIPISFGEGNQIIGDQSYRYQVQDGVFNLLAED